MSGVIRSQGIATPNPLIERTSPAKSGGASHLKRYALSPSWEDVLKRIVKFCINGPGSHFFRTKPTPRSRQHLHHHRMPNRRINMASLPTNRTLSTHRD